MSSVEDDHVADAMRAVERSLPNPRRPRLSTEIEAQLEPVDHRAALCYAQLELVAERMDKVDLRDGDGDGVPDVDIFEDTSTVQHIEHLRALLKDALTEEEEP